MSWIKAGAAAVLASGIPLGAAWGADLELGLGAAVDLDSNVLRSNQVEFEDAVFRVQPRIRLLEDEGKFTWNLTYGPSYEAAVRESQVDGFRHFLTAQAGYDLDRRTQFSFTDSFRYSEAVDTITSIEEAGTPTINTRNEPVLRNIAVLGMVHAFTPRLSGALSVNQELFRSDAFNASDNMTFAGIASSTYQWSLRHAFGGGLRVAYQDFERSNNGSRPAQQTLFATPFVSWTWAVDETTSLEMNVGPTYIDANQDAQVPSVTGERFPSTVVNGVVRAYTTNNCPPSDLGGGLVIFDPLRCSTVVVTDPADQAAVLADQTTLTFLGPPQNGGSASEWTWFANLNFSKRWSPNVVSAFEFQRRDDSASGVAGSTILDAASLLTTWRITERWSTAFRADFTRRQSEFPTQQTLVLLQETDLPSTPMIGEAVGLDAVTLQQAVDTIRWGVSARLTRLVTRHLTASVRYSYNQQESKGQTVGSRSDFGNHIVTFGVQYDFDRWHLW